MLYIGFEIVFYNEYSEKWQTIKNMPRCVKHPEINHPDGFVLIPKLNDFCIKGHAIKFFHDNAEFFIKCKGKRAKFGVRPINRVNIIHDPNQKEEL